MELNLFGDPELYVYTDDGSGTPVVECNISSFTPGDTTVTVTVKDIADDPYEDAVVCLYKENEDYAVDTTDANGQVTISFHPDSAGYVLLTVRGDDRFNPKQDTIQVNNATGSAVITATACNILDKVTGSTWGNDNNKLDAGEKVALDIYLHNGCVTRQTGVYMKLSASNQYVTIQNDSCSYENLRNDETKKQNS